MNSKKLAGRARRRSDARMLGLAGVAVSALLVAACGDDDDDADEAPAPTSAPAATTGDTSGEQGGSTPTTGGEQEPSGEPIKLMVIFDGAGVAVPEAPDGATAAAEALNEAGGLGGRPVEILSCDTKNDPNAATDCGKQAVDEGVLAVIGSFSLQSGQFLPLLEQARIPSIGSVPATAADFTSPASFPFSNPAALFAAAASTLAEDGATTISNVRLDIPDSAAFGAWMDMGLANYGLKTTNDVPVPIGAPDMSSYAAAATANDADGAMVGMTSQDAINFVIAARQVNPDLRIAMSTQEFETVLGSLYDSLGDDADGIIRVIAVPADLPLPAYEEYKSDMADAGFENTGGELRINSYVSVKAIEQLVAQLPEVTSAALYDLMPTVTDLRTGFIPPLQFTQGNSGGIPRAFNSCMAVFHSDGGELVPVEGYFIDGFTGEPCPAP